MNLTLSLQVLWGVLCIFWNLAGVYLINSGKMPLGPTATIAGAVATVVIIGLFIYFRQKRWSLAYGIVSVLAGILAAYTVYGGLVKDHSLWPSEFWRMAGIAVNTIGILAAIMAVKDAIGWSSSSINSTK